MKAVSEPLRLNLTEIVRSRAGEKGKWIPGFLLRGLERIIRQDELNEMLRVAHPAVGSEFSQRILKYLNITLDVTGLDNLISSHEQSNTESGEAFVFASNHPLGGLDGIALVAVLGEAFGDDNLRVVVNDLLMNVTPLSNVFLPVNKYGKKGARESSLLLAEAMDERKQIVMFPAGLVSRLQAVPSDKHYDTIRDLAWKKSFVTKALEFGRRIVPVKFVGLNSMKFYRTARVRKKLGLKINIEQAFLPSEVCKSRGKHYEIKFGTPVDPALLIKEGKTVNEIVARIYEAVYSL